MCKAKKNIESFHPEDKHLKSITYQINHTFAKSSNSNQNSECIKEILVNDGRTELELETDSLVDDLSNTETPEDGQQIGCVKLRNLTPCETRLFQLQLCMLSRIILVIQAW